MTTVLFSSDTPEQAIEKLRRLASDLARIRAGEGPTAAELENAPLLDGWARIVRPAHCLAGAVRGHPRLGDRPLIATTEVFAIDPVRGWARTYSRFYALGATLEERIGGAHG
jgi:hypothetical protein